MNLAANFSVSGERGVLTLIAAILFGIAAVVAWFAPPHKVILILLAAGLCLSALAALWS